MCVYTEMYQYKFAFRFENKFDNLQTKPPQPRVVYDFSIFRQTDSERISVTSVFFLSIVEFNLTVNALHNM